ncbi:MAG TPA: DUF87 domain-containing protein, partial [Pilimelia sp.]|nr:DUF87 domain-containing protein [Pilimelia sp.]
MNTPNPNPHTRLLPGLPDAVLVGARSVRVGDDFCATLAVSGMPAEVGPAWLDPLLSYRGRLDVAVHIEPVPAAVASQRLRKQRARLESTRRADASRGRLDDPDLDAAAYDAAELAARLARGEGRLFRLGVYITVHATSARELSERVAQVRSLASAMLIETAAVTWRQLQGWITTLPLGYDGIGMARTVDTDVLATSFPFASPDLPVSDTGGGVLFGFNLHSSGVVVWDRWAQDNANAVILARSGAGKSYLAKLDLLRNLYQGVEAFAVDPEGEYVALAEAVGGTVIRPGAPGVRINPFDLHSGDSDAFNRQGLFAHTLIKVLLAGDDPAAAVASAVSADEASALDTAIVAAYGAKGITADPRTWRRRAPLLADVVRELAATDGHGRALAARLRPFVSGAFSRLFDGPTTTAAQGHLVVYALRDLADELKPAAMLLTLDTITRTVTAPGSPRRRMVLVDEAWTLLQSGLAARYLLKLA